MVREKLKLWLDRETEALVIGDCQVIMATRVGADG